MLIQARGLGLVRGGRPTDPQTVVGAFTLALANGPVSGFRQFNVGGVLVLNEPPAGVTRYDPKSKWVIDMGDRYGEIGHQ
jgi:hypothetical protein